MVSTVAPAAARRPREESERNPRRIVPPGSPWAARSVRCDLVRSPEKVLPMIDFTRGGVLGRYFAGVCEYIFASRLGVADPPLVDYVSDLMLRFARLDTV